MRLFHPILAGAGLRARSVAALGAAIGIALTLFFCALLPSPSADLPFIVAPLGASAVLLFAVPSSPLAQPWPVIGGNVLSTLVGVAAFHAIPETALAAGVAVGGAILLMSMFGCLHPPGGAAALTAVIGGQGVHAAGYFFALDPVAINSVLLVATALLFHRLTGRSFPHKAAPSAPTGVRMEDIDAALADMDESFDISREDLRTLISRAEEHAARRGWIGRKPL